MGLLTLITLDRRCWLFHLQAKVAELHADTPDNTKWQHMTATFASSSVPAEPFLRRDSFRFSASDPVSSRKWR